MERTLFLANQKTAFAQPILEGLCTAVTQILVWKVPWPTQLCTQC